MKEGLRNQIIGSVVLLVFVAIPLGFILTPTITVAFVVGALLGILGESRASTTSPKKTESKSTKLSKDDEELITTILPVINDRNK